MIMSKEFRKTLIDNRHIVDRECKAERNHKYLKVNDKLVKKGLTGEQLLILREKLYDFMDDDRIITEDYEEYFLSGRSDDDGERSHAITCTYEEVIRWIDNLL